MTDGAPGEPVPGYPTQWETDVVLTDGGTVHVRPIRPDDAERLVAFHGRQSAESIYFRYFSPRPRLTEREVEHLTHLDYVDRLAFVAVLDDEMVGVARYDRWPTRAEAEVAFFVDDEHHGRGIATLLLEYLAAAASEAGITAFTATVLPHNRRMVGVFRAAGFTVDSRFDEGVIEVHLGLEPTPEAEQAVADRARHAESEAVRRLFEPRSVAVIGASREPGSVGHEVVANLLARGFTGQVYAVNPAADTVCGVRAEASVLDVRGEVDLAIVCVPAAAVPSVADECGQKRVRALIVISSGFAEVGADGAALELELLATCRRYGMRLLGPNCLGVINADPSVRLHATFATPAVEPGPVALVAESGTIGAVIVDHARHAGLGLSTFAAIGNRADVSANDVLQYWADDPRTELVLLYLESFGNPRRFSRIARRLARVKPVVAVRSGRSARAFPGDDRLPDDAVDAVLRQNGVLRVDTLSQLLDTARALAGQPVPAGDRVAIIGNSGGSLVLAADACVDAGLELAVLSDDTASELLELSGGRLGRLNPLDLGLGASGSSYEQALRVALSDAGVDMALVVHAPGASRPTGEIAKAIAHACDEHPSTLVLVATYGPHDDTLTSAGGRRIPVFDFPDAAAYALGRVSAYGRWLREPEGDRSPIDGVDDEAVAAARAALPSDGWADPYAVAALLGASGIDVAPFRIVDGGAADIAAAAANVGFPVAIKAMTRTRLAKSELAGVALDVHDEAEATRAFERMEGVLGDAARPTMVQAMATPGLDVAVSVRAQHDAGPVLTLGPGGAASVVGPSELRVLPMSDLDARRLVEGSAVGPLLEAGAAAQLEAMVRRVDQLVELVPEIADLELNPVLVTAKGAVVVDAQCRVTPPGAGVPAVRRL